MNSFGFSLDQEKSFPRRIGSVPWQEQCFPWASGPRETLFCLGTLPLYSGMKFLGLVNTLLNSWFLLPFSSALYHFLVESGVSLDRKNYSLGPFGPSGIIILSQDTPSLLGNDNSWSRENPHKFMGPPAFFLVIISFPHRIGSVPQ